MKEIQQPNFISGMMAAIIVAVLTSLSYVGACMLFGADINPVVAAVLPAILSLIAYRRSSAVEPQIEFPAKPVKPAK